MADIVRLRRHDIRHAHHGRDCEHGPDQWWYANFLPAAVSDRADVRCLCLPGQYHWVSEFSPPNVQKPISFAVGWLAAFGWQCAMPSVAFIGGQQVLALVSICDRSFVIQGWHSALLTMAFVSGAIFFNTVAIGKLPILEGLAVVFHFFGFFAFLVIMWVMGPRGNAADVFTNFQDDNHWGSVGLSTLIAMVAPIATYIGGDSAVHLAEELKDASYVLPRAMISASMINYIMGFATTVTLMFNLGNLQDDLADMSGQPWVVIIYRITGSKAATIVLLVVMITLVSREEGSCIRSTG